jgi:signal peptidase II
MAELPAACSPKASSSTFRLRLAIVLLTLSLFGCDHATKVAAHASLSHGEAINVVSGILELRFAANDDTAFSLLRTFGIARTPGLLLAASALALVGVVAMWVASRKRASRIQHVGFALVLAGALGNVVDRAMRGYVVDFIHLTRWPIFNVADIAVVAGVILLGYCAVSQRSEPGSRPPAPAGPS